MAPRPLTLVFVLDGLRPDSITAADTPTLDRLRAEGVSFSASHAAFPTVTRVNAATIATGTHPGTHGIVGNTMYVPAIDPRRAVSNGDWQHLVAFDRISGGRVVPVPTLAERLERHGLRYAAVSSGSTGSAFLLNPRAPRGVGTLVNGYFDPGTRVAFPASANAAILTRFGPAPAKGRRAERYDALVDWTGAVLREYVLRELRPDVAIAWLTEPDHIQHALGAGSPEARAAIANDDRHVGATLQVIEALGLRDRTNVVVVSDHGFGVNTGTVDVRRELIEAGLKRAADSDDVIVASSGQAIGLYVKDHGIEAVQKIVAFLQSRAWIGVIFTADGRGEGTFPLELVNARHAAGSPDILFTFPWTSAPNAFGVPGTDVGDAASPVTSDHGSMSPWTIRNTMLAWGPRFKRGVTVGAPAGNVDVAPTVLALHGLDASDLDGRVLHEAFVDGPDEEQVNVETRAYTTEAAAGAYRAIVQVSEVDGRRYVDKGWRAR
jgi:arylsulfatase A-like enzyme